MTIDIIDLNDPAYQDLSPVQMAMVRAAQSKKDALVAEGKAEKQKLFNMMLANNFVRAITRQYEEKRIDDDTAAKTEVIKQDLLYQLAYEALGSEGNDAGPYRYPENPNYKLTASQRFLVVRNYYMEIESDPEARLQAYSMDSLARTYLGEFYQTLYEQLASYVR